MRQLGVILLVIPLIAAELPRVHRIHEAEVRYGKLLEDYTWHARRHWLIHRTFGPWTMYVNRDLDIPLSIVEHRLNELGLMGEIQQFWGCYNPRGVTGREESPSAHAWGLACDFHHRGEHFSKQFIKVWEDAGFCWGGKFPNRDTMHFSWSWECLH